MGADENGEPVPLLDAAGKPVLIPRTDEPVKVRNARDKQFPGDVANMIVVAQVKDNGRVDYPKARAVMTAHLRAPWDEGYAKVKAHQDAKAASAKASTARIADRMKRLDAAKATLAAAGVPLPSLAMHWGDTDRVDNLGLADLEAIASVLTDLANR